MSTTVTDWLGAKFAIWTTTKQNGGVPVGRYDTPTARVGGVVVVVVLVDVVVVDVVDVEVVVVVSASHGPRTSPWLST